jgi:hypothetical protein
MALGKELLGGTCHQPSPSAPLLGTRQRVFAERKNWALGKVYFFCFLPSNFFFSPYTLSWSTSSNLAHFSVFLLYTLNLFYLITFFQEMYVWTAGASNHGIRRVEKWYSHYLLYFEAVSRSTPEVSNISRMKHGDKVVGEVFFNYIKWKRSLKIMKLGDASLHHMWRLW